MPELPEVETSRRGIEPYVKGQTIRRAEIRNRALRWPVARDFERRIAGQRVDSVGRRAKYLLFNTEAGSAILHLGMSGSVTIVPPGTPAGVHDHVDLVFGSGDTLRFRDPRRFGSLHWTKDPAKHKLLRDLGPEPLGEDFGGHSLGDRLWQLSRGRRIAVKPFIMTASVVVGVGNIYASEALFIAGINPRRQAGRVSRQRYASLAGAIREVLSRAIEAGGTTLRDFYGFDGQAGYFQQQLDVYGREGEPCHRCNAPIRNVVLGQRATYYCTNCQR
ncbi:MAG: bifunctional DNA-formamidopyrimidine glycosylase/DNA-(apurinic or apyrimidinic site) lyase [Pseudomonadota bacterium]